VVTVSHDQAKLQIILKPNRSLNWRGNQLLIASFAVIALLITTVFIIAGAWVIAPFAGLEILLLSTALYYVCWKLNFQQVISIVDQRLVIEKGYYKPKQRWSFDRDNIAVAVKDKDHPWDAIEIMLFTKTGTDKIPIGEFLNKEDCEILLSALRQAQLPIKDYSRHGSEPF